MFWEKEHMMYRLTDITDTLRSLQSLHIFGSAETREFANWDALVPSSFVPHQTATLLNSLEIPPSKHFQEKRKKHGITKSLANIISNHRSHRMHGIHRMDYNLHQMLPNFPHRPATSKTLFTLWGLL